MNSNLRLITIAVIGIMFGGCNANTQHPDAAKPAVAAPVAVTDVQIVRFDPALDSVIAPGTQIEKVASGFNFTEGPMWREGRLWFSDLTGNKMYAVTPEGKITLLMDHAGGLESFPAGAFLGSNAMITDKDGSVLMMQHGLRRIVRLDDQLTPSTFIDRFEGKRLNSPNDLVFAPDGSLWFTDPPYGLPGQDKDPAKTKASTECIRYAGGKQSCNRGSQSSERRRFRSRWKNALCRKFSLRCVCGEVSGRSQPVRSRLEPNSLNFQARPQMSPMG